MSVNSISDERKTIKCKYYDKGLCFRRENCYFLHPVEICKEKICGNKQICSKRHPKACLYYYVGKNCKFKDNCIFKHVESIPEKDHEDLKVKNVELEANIVLLELKLEQKESELKIKDEKLNCSIKQLESLKESNLKNKRDNENELQNSQVTLARKESHIVTLIKEKEEIHENLNMQMKQVNLFNREKDSLKKVIASRDKLLKVKSDEIDKLNLKLKETLKSKCDFCHEEVTSSVNLNKHTQEKHTKMQSENMDKWLDKSKTGVKAGNVTEFDCSYCNFTSISEFSLTSHKTLKHVNDFISEDSLQCGNCDYKTSSEKGLNLHIEVCQSLNYKCEKCHFKCTTAILLKRHIIQKH